MAAAKLEIGDGLPAGWFGHFKALTRSLGLSAPTARALARSLQESDDPDWISINHTQRFVTVEAARDHLARLADRPDG